VAVTDPGEGPPLAMNPFVDIHLHPAPEAYPIDVARIEVITVRCPVRGRGLVIRELTPAGDPALFGFFVELVARGGELELDSDAALAPALAGIGFLVAPDEVVDWPRFAVPLPDAPATSPLPDATWIASPSLRFQPAFALHPGVRWPADYDEQEGRLRCFAPGPVLWIGDPAARVEPYWVGDNAATALAGLVPGAPPPPLPPGLARALVQVGALVPPAAARPDPLARFARHRVAFEAGGHAIVSDLVSAAELAALRRYYAALLDAGLVPLGDRQSAARYSAYNDPVGRFVHARLAGTMSAVVGQPVVPSFSYFFSYLPGAALEPHKDRPQAEFSISLQIDHGSGHSFGHPPGPSPADLWRPPGPTSWPLCFTFDDGRTAAADLAIGDAVLYHGRALTHYRPRLADGQCSSILVLEYVPEGFAGLLI
jgi:hypothetical protein